MQTTRCAGAYQEGKKVTPQATSIKRPLFEKPCKPCRGRKLGFVCNFRNFRAFRQLENGTFDLTPRFFHTAQDTIPDLPSEFNVPFTESQASLLKTVAAEKLSPTMRKEYDHAAQDGAVRMSRELGTINNCDTCLHVILCGSWLCGSCGDEICFDCYSVLEGIERKGKGESAPELDNLSSTTLKKVATCQPKQDHGPLHFVPLTRMDVDELERTVTDMEDWKKQHSIQLPKQLPQEWILKHSRQPEESENSHPYLQLPSSFLANSRILPTNSPQPSSNAAQDSFLNDLDLELDDFDPIPSFPENIDSSELFQSIWSRGEPLVVDLSMVDHSELPWDPAFFIDRFGDEEVTIGSNVPNRGERKSTVGEFFATFGKKGEFSKSEKIKVSNDYSNRLYEFSFIREGSLISFCLRQDWPPSTDFREDFPDLWKDVSRSRSPFSSLV